MQKKGGRYYTVYTVGKKQKWEKVSEPNTKKNAERLLAQRVTEINQGEYRDIKKATFAEFAQRCLSEGRDKLCRCGSHDGPLRDSPLGSS